MLSAIDAECHKLALNAECRCAECRYAECCDASIYAQEVANPKFF
jgi:hypothetical protein